MVRFYDAFHGVGGFRYGLEQAGLQCVGGCEIDKYACQAYGVIFNEKCEPTDITTVEPLRLPNFDVFVGGFPCQDLSVAGNRKGFDGKRSVLFFEILRICSVKRPDYILLENVTGLFSHNEGETFEIVLKSLDELGYDAEWQVLNGAVYAPQSRERVFIIGHLRGASTRTVFPFGEKNKTLGINIIGTVKAREDSIGQRDIVHDPSGIVGALTATDYKQPKLIQLADGRIRRLTPLECFRLQTWPDEWHDKLIAAGISNSQLYKQAGNAVMSAVAYEIGKRLMECPTETEIGNARNA